MESLPSPHQPEHNGSPNPERYAVEQVSSEERAAILQHIEEDKKRGDIAKEKDITEAREALEVIFNDEQDLTHVEAVTPNYDDEAVIVYFGELGIPPREANRFLDSLYNQNRELNKGKSIITKNDFLQRWAKAADVSPDRIAEFTAYIDGVYDSQIPAEKNTSEVVRVSQGDAESTETTPPQAETESATVKSAEVKDRESVTRVIESVSKLRNDLNAFDTAGNGQLGFSDAVVKTRQRIEAITEGIRSLERQYQARQQLVTGADTNRMRDPRSGLEENDKQLHSAVSRLRSTEVRQSTYIRDIVSELGRVNNTLREFSDSIGLQRTR